MTENSASRVSFIPLCSGDRKVSRPLLEVKVDISMKAKPDSPVNSTVELSTSA